MASEEELLLEAPDPRYHGSGVFAPSQFAPGGDPDQITRDFSLENSWFIAGKIIYFYGPWLP